MEVTIKVYDMTCGHCQKRVADAISSLEGVESVDVNLESESATVSFDPEKVSLDDIKAAIQKAGYPTESENKAKKEAGVEVPEITEVEGETSQTAEPVLEGPEGPEEVPQTCPLTETCELPEKEPGISSLKTGRKEITLGVSGMTCSASALNIERVLKKKA
ncbi:MAG TPA: heavy-metal-associated domain-containing protein, partial [Methanosarcina vacuolata]|nr:heavy-metal-associated domain-containing protein [Methanosarcina vacuolata]